MALTCDKNYENFEGHGNDPYLIPFPIFSPAHVHVEVKAEGEDEYTQLAPGEFSVHELPPPEGGYEVTTTVAYPDSTSVVIYRWVPLTQPLVLPLAGSLPGPGIERALDLAVMRVQQLYWRMMGEAGLTEPVPISPLGIRVFDDAAERMITTPDYLGQAGVQRDTRTVYVGTLMIPNGWSPAKPGAMVTRIFASNAARNAEAPDFAGQLVGVDHMSALGMWNSLSIGYGTSVGQWLPVGPVETPFSWQYTGWPAGDPLVPGQRRWVGNTPLEIPALTEAFISCDTPGGGEALVKVHLVSLGGELTTAPVTLTPGGVGSALLVPANWSAVADGVLPQRTRIEVEVLSVGDPVTVTSVGGSTVSTPPPPTPVPPGSPALTTMKTGAIVSGENKDVGFVLFTKGSTAPGATVKRSHPAPATTTETLRVGGRIFVRGIEVTLAGGVTVIPASTADLLLIAPGDTVIGPTVPPDTKVVSKGVDHFVINHPLTGSTEVVTVTSTQRPPVLHFLEVATALDDDDAKSIVLVPTTDGIRVGDRPFGEYVPATAYVAEIISDESFRMSEPVDVEDTLVEITVRPPSRTATVVAGNVSATLGHATGLLVGTMVTGPGASDGTYITNIYGSVMTVNKPLTRTLTGAATDLFEFTREKVQVPGSVAPNSTTLTVGTELAYLPVNQTPVIKGMSISGPGIPPGATVEDYGPGPNQITMSKAAVAAVTEVPFVFAATPAAWRGLQLTLNGILPLPGVTSLTD